MAVLVLTVGVSVAWMTQAMNDQSRSNSGERVRTALFNVLEQTRATTLDYAKSAEAAAAVGARDVGWLDRNLGSAATVGEVAQLAVVWGGPFPADIGWSDDGRRPRADLLASEVISQAEGGLDHLPLGAYRGVTFFAWANGEVYALAAARVEATGEEADPAAEDAALGRVIMGRRLDEEIVRGIGESVLLDGFEVVRAKPSDRPSLPLMSGDARPVAHLAWDPHLAGTALLRRMLPPLALVTAVATALVLVTMALMRRSASRLVLAEQRSSRSARTDGLTGLPNRLAFTEVLSASARAGERAILFLDVNGFKRINDSIGHAAGDVAIKGLAERLVPLGGPDSLLARIGGDEFVFVLTGPDAKLRVEWLSHAIERAMHAPFGIQGHQVRLRGAIGYAVQTTDWTRGEDLVRQADLAMYEAKRHKGGAVAFGEMIDQADRDARLIERALRAALAAPAGGGGFHVAYQPIVAVGSRHLVRAEALARWTSAELGPVPPDRFIAVAEQAGLMVELGQRILQLICDDLVAWPDLRVSLNVSPLQLMAPTFVPDLVSELARRGVAPDRIEVELTEGVVVDDPRLATARLGELRAAGFSTALDDFGTGYSSIGYLQQMPFDTVKVDRSFVSGLCGSSEQLMLCNGIILIGRALGLAIVCEGVETADELSLLATLGCGLAQGYHLDKPLPIERLIERWMPQARPAQHFVQATRAAVA